MTFAVHDGSTGYHDHKEMDVFVGLTSVLPLQGGCKTELSLS